MTIDTVALLVERHGLTALAFPQQGVVYGMDGERTVVDIADYSTAGGYWSAVEAHGGVDRSRCEIPHDAADGESKLSEWLESLGLRASEPAVELLDADLGEWLENQPEAPSTAVIPLRTPKHLATPEARQVAHAERFDRAAETLDVKVVRPGVYEVTGGSEMRNVNLADPTMPRCDCPDMLYRKLICKHVFAAKMFERGGDVGGILAWAEANYEEVASWA